MSSFVTIESFGTLVGCVATVVVLVNTTRHVFDWGPRWFGLLSSIVVSAVAFSISKSELSGPIAYMLVMLNGCLIYTSAFGIQNTVVSPGGVPNDGPVVPGPEILDEVNLTFQSKW